MNEKIRENTKKGREREKERDEMRERERDGKREEEVRVEKSFEEEGVSRGEKERKLQQNKQP